MRNLTFQTTSVNRFLNNGGIDNSVEDIRFYNFRLFDSFIF